LKYEAETVKKISIHKYLKHFKNQIAKDIKIDIKTYIFQLSLKLHITREKKIAVLLLK